jgi:hypothetical protein
MQCQPDGPRLGLPPTSWPGAVSSPARFFGWAAPTGFIRRAPAPHDRLTGERIAVAAGSMTAAGWQAMADWVIAADVIFGATSLWRPVGMIGGRFWRSYRKKMTAILDREVAAGFAWGAVTPDPGSVIGVRHRPRPGCSAVGPPSKHGDGRTSEPGPATRLPAGQDSCDGLRCRLGSSLRTCPTCSRSVTT